MHHWRLLAAGLVYGIVGLAGVGRTEAAGPAGLPGVAFVGGPVVEPVQDDAAGSYHWRDGYVYPKGATNNAWERTHSAPRPGRNLYSVSPAGPEGRVTQLTFLKTGSVYDPEPDFSGRKLLFSMRKDGEDWYHLFEIGIDGSGLRQLTDGPFNDVSGAYLPDGRIVFCSDRSGVLDEYHEERSEFLFRIDANGRQMQQLTFTPGIYFEPTVLQNGLILCSFWDAFHISVPPFLKHETYLVTLRPDGTEERPFFGAGEYRFYNRTRHASIGLTKPGELPDGRILVQSEMGPSIYDPDQAAPLARALEPVFPATVSAQIGGTTHTAHLSPLGTRSTPYPLPDGRFLMAATLPGSRDFGLYVVQTETREVQLLYDRPNLSEWDPVPIGVPRPVPHILPDKARDAASAWATFVVAAAGRSDSPARDKLNERARFVRMLAAEYTDLAVSSHTSLETRILGTVPIQFDGSIAFEAPAETPLFLETLDARGNRLVTQRGYMTARAGEVKSCFGCHVSPGEAVPNVSMQALELLLPRIVRDSTDLSYRRNDPDEYRRQAQITQSPRYRGWLESPLAEVRRRGLEMLGYLPDEITSVDRARFVLLLADPASDVRRQAAHTLAMTGSADQIPALVRALDDTDWQTVHYASMALEAITGDNLGLKADVKTAPPVWRAWWRQTGSVAGFVKSLAARGPAPNDEFARDAWLDAVGRTRWLAEPAAQEIAALARPGWLALIRTLLAAEPPPVAVVRAAGLLADSQAVGLVAPWLIRGARVQVEEATPDSDDALQREFQGTMLAKEAAWALGRIGDEAAVAALWQALAVAVPNKAPVASRHYQTGPRPEEYTYLRALISAGAVPKFEQVPLLVALLPSTFGEKPRFEDRTKDESQRVALPRILLERAGLRQPATHIAADVLRGAAAADSPLYRQLLAGINLDRPYSEHGHPFPVKARLDAQEALHLLACLAVSRAEIPEPQIIELLRTAPNRSDRETAARERIEAAVVLRLWGFSPAAEQVLLEEIRRPYAFREIWSIGKGRFDENYRDKAYFSMALAAHAANLQSLVPLADDPATYRDVRLGLALGLGFRATNDNIARELLTQLSHDPLFSVHREAAHATVQIVGKELLAGRLCVIELPAWQPLAPGTAAPGAYAFADHTPDPQFLAGKIDLDPADPGAAVRALQSAVDATCYASVGNTFARNAERMRIVDAHALAKVLDNDGAVRYPANAELDQALAAALDSPYPYAHYLAARFIAARGDERFIAQLVHKLPLYVEAADTVGFYWAADALGRLRADAAAETLDRFAVETTWPKTWGPIGMAYGFAAARALGMIGGDPARPPAAGLLASDNVWLRAGALDGLIARGAPGVTAYLRGLTGTPSPAVVASEVRFGLRALRQP